RFISSVLLSGPDSNRDWRKIRGSRHSVLAPRTTRSMDVQGNVPIQMTGMRDDQAQLGIEFIPVAGGNSEGSLPRRMAHLDVWVGLEDQAKAAHEPLCHDVVRKTCRKRQARRHQIPGKQLGLGRIKHQLLTAGAHWMLECD